MESLEVMRKTIIDYVRKEQIRRGITRPDESRKMELSGIMQGENGDIISLLDTQLMTTKVGYGAWTEIDDPEILQAVYREVRSRFE